MLTLQRVRFLFSFKDVSNDSRERVLNQNHVRSNKTALLLLSFSMDF